MKTERQIRLEMEELQNFASILGLIARANIRQDKRKILHTF